MYFTCACRALYCSLLKLWLTVRTSVARLGYHDCMQCMPDPHYYWELLTPVLDHYHVCIQSGDTVHTVWWQPAIVTWIPPQLISDLSILSIVSILHIYSICTIVCMYYILSYQQINEYMLVRARIKYATVHKVVVEWFFTLDTFISILRLQSLGPWKNVQSFLCICLSPWKAIRSPKPSYSLRSNCPNIV